MKTNLIQPKLSHLNNCTRYQIGNVYCEHLTEFTMWFFYSAYCRNINGHQCDCVRATCLCFENCLNVRAMLSLVSYTDQTNRNETNQRQQKRKQRREEKKTQKQNQQIYITSTEMLTTLLLMCWVILLD